MKSILTLALVLLFGTLASGAAPSGSLETRLGQFLAGTEILRDAAVDAKTKIIKYRSLVRLTGLTASQVSTLIIRYKTDPAGWNRVQQVVHGLLEVDDE